MTITSLADLRALAFDVDGVLTDGRILWGPAGEEFKRFGFRDIMGLSLARRLGLKLALISGENSPHVTRYAEKLKVHFVRKGCRDKATALGDFAAEFKIPVKDLCFFGDDVNDLSAMKIAGHCACPADAADEVRAYVSQHGFVASRPGGHGAVRELIDAILRTRDLRGEDVFLLRPPE